MVQSNNNVEKIRRKYETHAADYLRSTYPDAIVTLKGHTNPFRSIKDIELRFGSKVLTVEVKGSVLLDPNGKYHPRWQRIKFTTKDYNTNNPADLFLFVYDAAHLGERLGSCPTCHGSCNFSYQLSTAEDVLNLINDRLTNSKSIAISTIAFLDHIQLEEELV